MYEPSKKDPEESEGEHHHSLHEIEQETAQRLEEEVDALTGTKYIEHHSPEYRAAMLALFFAGFATFALLYCVQPLLPILSQSFDIAPAQSSLVLSTSTVMLAIGLLITGPVSDAIGRKKIMSFALFSAAFFTLVTSVMPSWSLVLASRALVGLSLAGLAAVAMTYLSEEMSPSALGVSMGVYVGGTAIGGMGGRVISGVLVDFLPWRIVMLIIGVLAMLAALAFIRLLPPSRNFVARKLQVRTLIDGYTTHFSDRGLPWLFLEGFLLMGSFVTMFNYIGYRLLGAPYYYSQSLVGLISIVYLSGIYSSAWGGALGDRLGRNKVFWYFTSMMLIGILLTLFHSIVMIVIGILVLTFGFFAAHSIASSWVGRRARTARGQASSLYLLFYYVGSSVAGTSGGYFWHDYGWSGVVGFISVMLVLATLIGWFRLHYLEPKPLDS